ncbi:hypothetical protein A1O3_00663 [Capronia epimyces CBS 606.96]|uniref:Enoyl reductase (ER) domain-containing protein n=1 Tax=Capronia epimyces CBS 606.96 TaxID=1182542 RepID=W9YHT2_9EURO|nr:uncharacterized protein A1O3_00663 [Capronia epimyces CBS 606.96]EXJ92113.1 hypothetical protein A1O3_00663 [Capronia epimyces CBS 606.96]
MATPTHTHAAVVTVGQGLPLEVHQLPTPVPTADQVRIRNEWTASTPLDLHQADGGLLVKHPQVLGDTVVGEVVQVGPQVSKLKVGDKVFGFSWRTQAEKGQQEFVVASEYLFGKLPKGISPQAAATVPNNFVTAWHTFTTEFGLELPWPKPESYVPKEKDAWILIWGGGSSVGQYALQILKWYGYANVVVTASKKHHQRLQAYGAAKSFDYRDRAGNVEQQILDFVAAQAPTARIAYILDCIGSLEGSVRPVARIARAGAKVAVMLPVIVKDAADGVKPEYDMDVKAVADWADGVQAVGVRTHFYLENKFLADRLQSEIMPTLLANRVVEPNDQVIVEGRTLLERAEKALSMLRRKEVSGARLVWRVSEQQGA